MSEQHQQFTELKKLLKLKQHEVPPPGFFNHFSESVIAGIRDQKTAGQGSLADRMNDAAPWLMNFLRFFEAKPGVVGGFATSLCLLLVLGVVLAERSETGSSGLFTNTATEAVAVTGSAPASASPNQLASVVAPAQGGISLSTNASLQPVASLFGNSGAGSLFQPAGFAPSR